MKEPLTGTESHLHNPDRRPLVVVLIRLPTSSNHEIARYRAKNHPKRAIIQHQRPHSTYRTTNRLAVLALVAPDSYPPKRELGDLCDVIPSWWAWRFLQRIVREQLERLVDEDNQIVSMVSADERLRYEAMVEQPIVDGIPRAEATSEEDFKFDLEGTRNSPWNKSAGRVFARIAMREAGLPCTYETLNCLQRAFTSHLDTIIRRYKNSQKPLPIQLQEKSKIRRQSRQYQLFLRRHQTAHQFEPLHKHITMLEELGIEGMSSDDSDRGDGDLVRYRIRSPAWRADAVTPWLRMFDTISRIFRREPGPGANPRIRNSTNDKSDGKGFVPGLPINAYDPSWLKRDARRKYDLCPTQETYDFTLDPSIIDLAMSYIIS
ncbi:hypothetical protein K438DRAFT_1961078 [Mycena galopus ATCC 62051]|nr:hypothetical protein K438DRAFT_1961078 [Mycena galopus ATCC 62051]